VVRATAALALVALLAASASSAAGGERQEVRSALTTKRPGASTGTRMEMRFVDPADPAGKPYAVDRVVVVSPRGARIDHDAVPQCTASDAELMARGADACPAGSQVQSGWLVLDTGSPIGAGRLIRFRSATFNAPGGFVSIGEAEEFAFRGVVRSYTDGRKVTVDYAEAPGFGGPDSQAAMTTMVTHGPPRGTKRRPLLRTPPSCPRSGRWTIRFTFIYHDGVRETERTRAPCRRKR